MKNTLLVVGSIALSALNFVFAQQLQYVVTYQNNPPSDTTLKRNDSTHIFYMASTSTESDSVKEFNYDDATSSYTLSRTKRFFYDAQLKCAKVEYYNSSGAFSGKDSIFYGLDGIDSIVQYDAGGNVGVVEQFFYNSSKLMMKYRLVYQPGNVIDTSRKMFFYDSSTGYLTMSVGCANTNDTSCTDTTYYYYSSGGRLDSLKTNDGSFYRVVEYDPTYDIFSNNILATKQTSCYISPDDLLTDYMPIQSVKAVTGQLYFGGTPIDVSMSFDILNATNTERKEVSYVQLVFPAGTFKENSYYYFTGSALPTSVNQPYNTWKLFTYTTLDGQVLIKSYKPLKGVRVFTVGGAVILNNNVSGKQEVNIDLSHLGKGMYYMQVVSTDGDTKFLPVLR